MRLLLLLALAASLLAQDPAPPQPAAPLIEPKDLKQLLEGPNPPLLLDVRPAIELEEEGALPRYLRIELKDLESRLADIPKNRPIITFCRSARRADAAAAILKDKGFHVIARAGIRAWKQLAYEVSYPPAQ